MIRKTDPEINGVLVVDKSKGPSSHDIVASLRRILKMRRIGHSGTLDPLASGVLVVCFGRYTRLNRWLSNVDKEYEATLSLGAMSATGDAQGPIQPTADFTIPSKDEIAQHIAAFVGEIDQVPHAYSAIKVAGVRSYKRARRGEEIDLKSRRITIHRIDILDYAFPRLTLRVGCSSGTYIRSLAEDLGKSLGTGAYLADLRRLQVGNLGIEMALTLDDVVAQYESGNIEEACAHPRQALKGLAAIELSEDRLLDFSQGKALERLPIAAGSQNGECAVFDAAETLFGIGRWENGALRPFCVLRQPQYVV